MLRRVLINALPSRLLGATTVLNVLASNTNRIPTTALVLARWASKQADTGTAQPHLESAVISAVGAATGCGYVHARQLTE